MQPCLGHSFHISAATTAAAKSVADSTFQSDFWQGDLY